MALDVGLTTDNTKTTVNSYSFHTFTGLTSTSDRFIKNLDATGASAWYVYDPSVTGYILFGQDVDEIPDPNLTSNNVTQFHTTIQDLLYNTAIYYGYASSDNFISYYNSGITAWRNEAIAFNTWRDNTETLMYDNIFSFTADGITLPDLAGFTGQTGYFDVGITASRPNLFS